MSKLIYNFIIFTFGFAINASSQWIHVTNSPSVYCLIEHDSILYAGTYDINGLYFSYDHGATWTSSNAHFPAVGILALAFKDTILFAGSDREGVWRTTDLGKSWTAANTGMSMEPIYGLTVIGSNIIASAGNGLYVSSDNGSSWRKTSDHYTYEFSCTPVASGGGVVYAATKDHLLLSADSGSTWSIALDSTMWWAVASNDLNAYVTGNLGFFRSTDHGKTWNLSSNMDGGGLTLAGKNILLGPQRTTDYTCFLSTDFGVTWINLQEGHRSGVIVLSGPNIVKGSTNTGIWYRPFAGLNKVRQINQFEIKLSPNPTTGILSIRNAPENLSGITILNVLGEEVMVIAVSHSRDFTIDLSKFPAGMYYARIMAENSLEYIEKILKQ